MSATSARVDEPLSAEVGPEDAAVAADVAIGDVSQPEGSGVQVESRDPATEKAEPIEAAQPAGGLPLLEEDAAERHQAETVARIRLSQAPAALKERFVEVAGAAKDAAKDAATVEACLKAVEESLPEFLQQNRGEIAREKHPAGEVFFRGNPDEITDEQAEEIAQRQLARSGLLRGQRVRVAD